MEPIFMKMFMIKQNDKISPKADNVDGNGRTKNNGGTECKCEGVIRREIHTMNDYVVK